MIPSDTETEEENEEEDLIESLTEQLRQINRGRIVDLPRWLSN
jgi:hypothetical protein